MTLFGKVFADVMKLRRSHFGLALALKPMTEDLIRRPVKIQRDKHRG